MKYFKKSLVLIIIIIFFVTGCAQQHPSYNGQTKSELKYVYIQKEKAVRLRKESTQEYFALEKECLRYTKNSRIAAANACNSKLKALGTNIEYFEEVIKNKNEIIENLDEQETKINSQNVKKNKNRLNRVLGIIVLGAILVWAVSGSNEEE